MFSRTLIFTLALLFTLSVPLRAEDDAVKEEKSLSQMEDLVYVPLPYKGKIEVWNYETGKMVKDFDVNKQGNPFWVGLTHLHISPDKKFLLYIERHLATVVDSQNLKKIKDIIAQADIFKCQFTSDSKYLFFLGFGMTYKAIATENWEILQEVKFNGGLADIMYTTSNNNVHIYLKEGEHYVGKDWNFLENKFEDAEAVIVSVSPNGKYAIQLQGNAFWLKHLISTSNKEEIWCKNLSYCEFLPDNRVLCVKHKSESEIGPRRDAFIFDPETKEQIPLSYMTDMYKVTTDGKYILFADGTHLCAADPKTGHVIADKIWDLGSEIRPFDVGFAKATLDEMAAKEKAEKEAAEKAKAEAEAKAKAEQEAKEKAAKEAAEAKARAEHEAELVGKLQKGFEFFTEGEAELAVEEFANVARFDPKDHRAPSAQALVQLYGVKDREAAFETMKTFMKEVKDDAVLLNNFGVLAMLNNEYATALTAFRLAAAVKPDAPELIQNVGLLMDLHKKKRTKFTDKQTKRLILLNAETVKKHTDEFNPQGPYRFMPITDSEDHAKAFTQRKAGKKKGETKPFEWWK